MNRIIMTAIAAAAFGSVAYADQASVAADTLMTRSEPATVTLFGPDRGLSGSDTIEATAGVAALVDARGFLEPRDQAVAVDGQVTVYSFASSADNSAVTFAPR